MSVYLCVCAFVLPCLCADSSSLHILKAASKFMDTANRVGPACGIDIGVGRLQTVNNDRAEAYLTAIR